MRIERKVRRLDAARRLLVMAVVQQDGAQDRHLRGQVRGQSGVAAVVHQRAPSAPGSGTGSAVERAQPPTRRLRRIGRQEADDFLIRAAVEKGYLPAFMIEHNHGA